MALDLTVNPNIQKDGEITFYERGIITKDGAASPGDFGDNLLRVKEHIIEYSQQANKLGKALKIVTGFHGHIEPPGGFSRPFNQYEKMLTEALFRGFKKECSKHEGALELEYKPNGIRGNSTSDFEAIKKYVEDGYVFFAWCFADQRVRDVVGHYNSLPN